MVVFPAGVFGVIALASFVVLSRRRSAQARSAGVSLTPALPGAEVAPEERREPTARSRRWIKVNVEVSSDELACQEAWIVDYDGKGVGLVMFREIPVGSVLRLRPANVDARVPWARVEVRHCRHLEKGTWAVGCSFLDAPHWGKLLMFG
jgi:hypothetical protein